MFYIHLIKQRPPPPKRPWKPTSSNDQPSKLDVQPENQATKKTKHYICSIQQVYYQERRLFL